MWRNRASRIFIYGLTVALGLLLPSTMSVARSEPAHALAMHGEPKHGPGFSHFPYVNPDAPKGGRINLGAIGTFDSLNPLIVKGVPAAGIRRYVFENLLGWSYDEPFTLYGNLAETVETPEDRSWVIFTLRENARFSDGMPVTVEDLIFSFKELRSKGRPNHRTYYGKVTAVERVGPRSLKFAFEAGGDREMPLIMGLMPVLPKHIYAETGIEQTTLDPPIGSGPYVVSDVDAGHSITYRRDPNYWGIDLPYNRGKFNFDEVHYEYYRDLNTAFEAFKAGNYDVWEEDNPARWATGFDIPPVHDGRIQLKTFTKGEPACMKGLVFNTRRAIFADKRVRKALIHAFDFEWMNRNLFHGAYKRTASYFDRSDLSSHGRPASDLERTLLEPYLSTIDADILSNGYTPPASDGSGRNRSNLLAAANLLGEAGWIIRDGILENRDSQRAFEFEILIADPNDLKTTLSYTKALERLGITANVRTVDSAQFQQRRQTYDYDMIPYEWCTSLSPGNEQYFYWGADGVTVEGTRNYAGASEPAIEAMIGTLLAARSREDFVDSVRAFDRVLLSGYYAIPLYYLPNQLVATWSHLKHPQETPLYGYRLYLWWSESSN